MSLSASAIADGADLQRYGDDTAAGGEAIDTANQEMGKAVASAPDMLVEIPRDEVSTVSTRKTEMELAATDVRTLALRCKDMPEVNTEARLLRRTVSDGAKSIMSGLDSSASECQKNLLEILDAGERRQSELVMTVVKGGHLFRELGQIVLHIQHRIDQIVGLKGSSRGKGCNVKFHSKCIKPELDALDRVLALFQQMEQKLETFCDPQHRELSLQAIQAASNQISSSDVLGEIAGVWEEWKEHEKRQKELETNQGQKEGVLRIKEAEKDFLTNRLKAATEETKRMKEMLQQKKQELQSLTKTKDCTADEFIFSCQAAKMEAQQRVQELQEKLEGDEKRSRVPLQECEEKITLLQRQSLKVELNINHIIFVVDNSGSMYGQRFRLATKAVEELRAACVHAGSQDKVSLVCFNSKAKSLVRAAPVTCKLEKQLQAEGCDGGTSFWRAWEHIEKCAQEDPKFAKLFVVFLSDGLSADVGEAAVRAESTFRAAEKSNRAMTTCFVHIDDKGFDPAIESHLQPLVKAANGGQTVVKYMDETIPLLQIVKSHDLVQAFKKLTTLVNIQKCLLDVRMSALQAQEREYRTRQTEASKILQARLKEEMKRLEAALAEAEKSSKAGKDQVEKLFKNRQKQMEQDINELSKDVEKAQDLEESLRKQVVQCEAEHKALESEFEKSKPAYEKMSCQLQEIIATHVSQVGKIHQKQQKLVDQFGCTNSTLLTLQLESLQKMKGQLSQNNLIKEDLHCIVSSIVRFTNVLKEQIENPAPRSDRVSTAKVALEMISQQRGLEYKNNPQEDMVKLLEYEANLQCKDPEEVMKTLVAAGISADEICAVIDAENADDVKEAKRKLVEDLQEKIIEQRGFSSQDLEKQIKTKKKELRTKKDELKQKELEMRASKKKATAARSAVSTSASEEEENQEWELVDDLEDKVEVLKEEKETLEDSLKTLESDLKDVKQEQKTVCKELQPCNLVLEFAADSCRMGFREYIAEQEKDALNGIFESFQNNVHNPITAFAAMTEQAREVFEQDVSSMSQPKGKSVCDKTDRSLALKGRK